MKPILYYFEVSSMSRPDELVVLSSEPADQVVANLQSKLGNALQIVYHESITPDGTPFVINYEK